MKNHRNHELYPAIIGRDERVGTLQVGGNADNGLRSIEMPRQVGYKVSGGTGFDGHKGHAVGNEDRRETRHDEISSPSTLYPGTIIDKIQRRIVHCINYHGRSSINVSASPKGRCCSARIMDWGQALSEG